MAQQDYKRKAADGEVLFVPFAVCGLVLLDQLLSSSMCC
jgi:hypothetical protein